MQEILLLELRRENPNAEIVCEQDLVDVRVRSDDSEVFYEIKTDLSTKTVLRQAIGQLLEYGHHGAPSTQGLRFVAVGRSPLSLHDAAHLATLQTKYGLPISYRVVRI